VGEAGIGLERGGAERQRFVRVFIFPLDDDILSE
jgi:hypothetical protein